MRIFTRTALLSMLLCSTLALAAGPKSLPGTYSLQGVTEVGSMLSLRPDGSYRWSMSYGNQDLASTGVWEVKGKRVVLTAKREPLKFRLFTEKELSLKKDPKPGVWVAIVGVPDMGPVSEVEVRFEAKSGKSAVAASLPNGDAIVTMPASELWTRAGLRRQGSTEPYQWVDVPAERGKARIAAFAIMNVEQLQNGFSKMELEQDKDGLVQVSEDGSGRGRYVKQSAD